MNVTQSILEELQDYIYQEQTLVENGAYFLSREADRVHLSYSKWAAGELMDSILVGQGARLDVVLERFIKKMEDYETRRTANTYMFSVARDFALNIYDLYCLLNMIDGKGIKK